MSTRSRHRLRLVALAALSVACLPFACVGTSDETSDFSDRFIVGGASGPAGAGATIMSGAQSSADPSVSGSTTTASGVTANTSTGAAATNAATNTATGATANATTNAANNATTNAATAAATASTPGFPNNFRLLSVATNRLVELQVNPDNLVPIGTADLTGTAIATSPDGSLIGLDTTDAGATQLVDISPTTGNVTPVQRVSGLRVFTQTGFANTPVSFAPTGTLFAAPGNILLTINPLNGQVTPVIAGLTVGAFTFTPAGTLVRTTATGLGTVNINTGLTTDILANQIPFAPAVQGLTFGPDGFIYAVSDQVIGTASLVRIDPTNGESVVLGTFPANLFGLAVQPLSTR